MRCLAAGLARSGCKQPSQKSSSLRSSHRSSLRSFATTFLALGLRPHGRFASKAPRKTLLRSSLRSSLSRGDYHYLRAEVNCNSIRSSLRSSLIELHSKYIKETINDLTTFLATLVTLIRRDPLERGRWCMSDDRRYAPQMYLPNGRPY